MLFGIGWGDGGKEGRKEEIAVGKIYFLVYISRAVIELPISLIPSSYNPFVILFIHTYILILSHIRVFIH